MTRRLLPWALPLLLLAFWQLLGELGRLPANLLPTPAAVVRAGWRLTESGELTRHLLASTGRAAAGFALGGGLGLLLGLLTGTSPPAERLLDTSVQMLRTVPHLAVIPLVILWFGIGESGRVFLVALGVLFPVYLNTHHGFRTIDPGLIEMGRVYGLGRWGLFRRVLLPGALPGILVGVRYGLGTMWLTLVVAETITETPGLGYLAMDARNFLHTDVVLLTIVLYALLGKLADTTARLLERLLLPWHPAYAKRGTR